MEINNLSLINEYLLSRGLTKVADVLKIESKFVNLSSDEDTLVELIRTDQVEQALRLVASKFIELSSSVGYCLVCRYVYLLLKKNSLMEVAGLIKSSELLNLVLDNHPLLKKDFFSQISILFSKKTKEEQLETLLSQFLFSNSPDNLAKLAKASLSQRKLSLTKLIAEQIRSSVDNCIYHNEEISAVSLYTEHKCFLVSLPVKESGQITCTEQEVLDIVGSDDNANMALILNKGSIQLFTLSSDLSSNYTFKRSFFFKNIHTDHINSACFNEKGTMLLTASKDGLMKLLDTSKGTVVKTINMSSGEVTCAIFQSGTTNIIASTLSQTIYGLNERGEPEYSQKMSTFGNIFYSDYLNNVVATDEVKNTVLVASLEDKAVKLELSIGEQIISASISKVDKGRYLLVNHSLESPVLSLIDLKNGSLVRKYFGHKQSKPIYKCKFGGYNDNFLTCGSEDACLLIWHRTKSIPIHKVKCHSAGINCVWWGGQNKEMLFTGSDDHSIKVFTSDKVNKVEIGNERNDFEDSKVTNLIMSSRPSDLVYFFNMEAGELDDEDSDL